MELKLNNLLTTIYGSQVGSKFSNSKLPIPTWQFVYLANTKILWAKFWIETDFKQFEKHWGQSTRWHWFVKVTMFDDMELTI
jgi:hypothetical protein